MKCVWAAAVLATVFACSRPAHLPEISQETYRADQVTVEGKTYDFRVFVPERRAEEKLPVMLFLHGSDERGKDNESQVRLVDQFIRERPDNFRFIMVLPQCRSGFWDGKMIHYAMAALDQSISRYNGDPDRTYLAGFSLGGYGTWQTAAMFPDKFAALVIMSGRVLPREYERGQIDGSIEPLFGTADPYMGIAQRLKETPIWIFHGDRDPIVPVEASRRMSGALKRSGNSRVKYTEYSNWGHLSIEKALREPELFQWLREQHR